MPSSRQAPAQTLSALFTLARAAGTGGALQGAARGAASRRTWRPKTEARTAGLGERCLEGRLAQLQTWASLCTPPPPELSGLSAVLRETITRGQARGRRREKQQL